MAGKDNAELYSLMSEIYSCAGRLFCSLTCMSNQLTFSFPLSRVGRTSVGSILIFCRISNMCCVNCVFTYRGIHSGGRVSNVCCQFEEKYETLRMQLFLRSFALCAGKHCCPLPQHRLQQPKRGQGETRLLSFCLIIPRVFLSVCVTQVC